MSMSDLRRAFELIQEMREADFHGVQPESLVVLAEETLGLKFPPTYRAFLAHLGCGGVIGCEFYGIIDEDFENSSVPDAIWLTLRHRKSTNLPLRFVFVSDTGDGGYYAIDTSRKTAEGDSPVVVWWPGVEDSAQSREVVAEDFGAFLLENVEWSIDDSKGE